MLGPFTTASHLKPIQQMSLAVLSRAACTSMSTTTPTTTTCDRGPLWPHGMGPIMLLVTWVQSAVMLYFYRSGSGCRLLGWQRWKFMASAHLCTELILSWLTCQLMLMFYLYSCLSVYQCDLSLYVFLAFVTICHVYIV